jgi:hypothetical protein
MRWIAPSERGAGTATLEQRLWWRDLVELLCSMKAGGQGNRGTLHPADAAPVLAP